MRFRYQGLDVTNDILALIRDVYQLTASFPSDERFGLASQLRRATNSILLNLAEGSARKSKKDFQRFITMSLGSVAEVHAACSIAESMSFTTSASVYDIGKTLEKIWFRLCALRESQNND